MHEPGDALDRLWAATRPTEPSPEQLDRLWGEVLARASEPDVLPISRFRSWGMSLGDGRGVVQGVDVRPQAPLSDTDQMADDLAVLSFMESYE